MTSPRSVPVPSAWAPLRVEAFRAIWIAQLFSQVGIWMQTVGAQWMLVHEPNAATLVGLVSAAALVPTLVLALPAGAMADIMDRKRLIGTVQLLQAAVGAGLALLAITDLLPPPVLITATFLLGMGTTLTLPAYQALVQELVGPAQARSATALNGVAMNLARAVGPAAAGILIGQTGVATVFALNALAYIVIAIAVLRLQLTARPRPPLPERFGSAVLAGTRYVRHSPSIRRLLLRTLLFVVPGAALWALLPLVASRRQGLDAVGYGILLGALGVGAIAGAAILPWVGARLTPTRLVVITSLIFGFATIGCVLAPNPVVAVLTLLPAGASWLCMLATMNSTLQNFLPGWVRARGLSVYHMAFSGGQGLASLAWGVLAEWFGLLPVLLAAGLLLLLGAASVVLWPLNDVSGLDRNPVVFWPEPTLELEPVLDDGPVVVIVTFTVRPENVEGFLAAMVPVRRMKMRTGATTFGLYRDGADPCRFVEVAQYPSWAEHLRQHGGRLTGTDRELEAAAMAFAEGATAQHLLPPGSGVVVPSGLAVDGPV